jgi:hypothetical protein
MNSQNDKEVLKHITGTINDTLEFRDRKGHRIAVHGWNIVAEPNNDIKELIIMLKKRQIDAIRLSYNSYITYKNNKLYRSSEEGIMETTEECIYNI